MNKTFLTLLILLIAVSVYGQKLSSVNQLSLIDHTITLNRMGIEINSDGFLKQIQTFYSEDHTGEPQTLLYEPIHFHYYVTAKTQLKLNPSIFKLISSSKDSVVWNVLSTADELEQDIKGEMLTNGLIKYKIRIRALKNLTLNSINFHIPFQKPTAKYLAGLNEIAGLRSDTVRWNANQKTIPAVWIGDEKQGIYLSLNEQKIFNQLNTKNGWLNEGSGKLQISIKGSSMLLELNTGNITLKQGEDLVFDCKLIVSEPQDSKKLFNPGKKFKAYRKLEIQAK